MKRWFEEKNAPKPGTELCSLDDMQSNEYLEFSFGEERRTMFRMFIHNDGSDIRGFMNMCPHFDTPLNNQPGEFFTSDRSKFMCMVHYAKFRFDDGKCVDGPCEGLSLETIPLEILDGRILIGSSD